MLLFGPGFFCLGHIRIVDNPPAVYSTVSYFEEGMTMVLREQSLIKMGLWRGKDWDSFQGVLRHLL